jgi:hypothetical protein
VYSDHKPLEAHSKRHEKKYDKENFSKQQQAALNKLNSNFDNYSLETIKVIQLIKTFAPELLNKEF